MIGSQLANIVVVIWRESVEALLIIGILSAWLRKRDVGGAGRYFLWAGVVGGLAVGYLSGPERFAPVAPLFVGLFQGLLVLFLLELGLVAARRLRDVRTAGPFLVGFAIAMPIVDGVIGASVGVAVIGREAGGAADILRYADMALYRAKNEGRNRTCLYDAAMDADLSQSKILEQDLREAIANDGLGVVHQPIVKASGERVVGVEALARWRHPTRGAISPAEFIPIAEHSGLIVALGANVLRRACLSAKAWPGITVSVNVSPLQFRRVDFVPTVERILEETGIDPSQLELELTESTLLGNVESAESAMHRIKTLGVKLALDDFGTGYSSLHYLRRFPFDRLKIDRSFVLSIENTADAAAIVHAIVSLGRGLGMKVTAEGVETAEQHLFLRAAGVQYMQGYRFGMPSSADEIARRLATPGVYRSIEGDAAAALAS